MRRLLNSTAGLALAVTAAASPAIAQTTSLTCQDRIILDCAKAMEDANPIQRFALGVYCSALIAACPITSINLIVKPT